MTLDTVRTVGDLRARVRQWRAEGLRVGLVPTMGALHEGHLSLVTQAKAKTDRVIVTLFVNPTQFAPHEDFSKYPRDEAGDRTKLKSVGADLLFAPGVEEMYPPGHMTAVSVRDLGELLEGSFRPAFFTGVATIVTKLLLQSLPDLAIFGEKDYQQLQVIKRFVQDLDIPVQIEGGETVREADGLAMSSRNAYLTPQERAVAPNLIRTLRAVAERFRAGEDVAALEAWAAAELLKAGFQKVDYVTVRDAASLKAPTAGEPARVLAAAFLGKARLIDNIPA